MINLTPFVEVEVSPSIGRLIEFLLPFLLIKFRWHLREKADPVRHQAVSKQEALKKKITKRKKKTRFYDLLLTTVTALQESFMCKDKEVAQKLLSCFILSDFCTALTLRVFIGNA